jgi:hypothetical protein
MLVLAAVVAAVGFLFLFFLTVPSAAREPADAVLLTTRMEVAVHLAARVTGLVLALVGGVSLLFRSAEDRHVVNALTCSLAILGGVLIMDPLWSTALALGLVAAAVAVLAMLARRPSEPSASRPVPDVVEPADPLP